jgi:glycyl-tRNA synthetase
VGHADRSAYDLRVHGESSKVELVAQETFSEAKLVDVAVVRPNMAIVGKKYGKLQKRILEVMKGLSVEEAAKIQKDLTDHNETTLVVDGQEFKLSSEEVSVKMEQKKITSQKYIPNVIEPSFGIGRILYHVLEHSFYIRPSASGASTTSGSGSGEVVRAVLGVPAFMAAVKVAILPISSNDKFIPLEEELSRSVIAAGLTSRVDSSGVSIGRRYARADEIGTPYAITIDFQSIEDRTVTIRERDSCQQIRVKVDDAVPILRRLINDSAHIAMHSQLQTGSSEVSSSFYRWEQAYATYEQVTVGKSEE